MPYKYCDVHERYLREYIESITILNNNIQWLTKIGKWAIGTLVTGTILVAGAVGTFLYKASDAYAQIQTNSKAIEMLIDTKGKPHG